MESKLRKFDDIECIKVLKLEGVKLSGKPKKLMMSFMDIPFGNPFRAERIIRKGKVGEAGS